MDTEEKPSVACIGSGNIGRAWAILFAMHGHSVNLYDISKAQLAAAQQAIATNLEDLKSAGLIKHTKTVRERIRSTTDLATAVSDTHYIQESVPEQLDLKKNVMKKLDSLAEKTAVVASSTSEIPGSSFMADLPGRHRFLVAHPLNPPYLIPMVELCPTPWTSNDTLDVALNFLTACGRKPIVVKKEISGFVANRLQLAVLAEAIHLVGEGYCTSTDIDVAMKNGLAMRWAFMGPLETAHLNASGGYKEYMALFRDCHKKITDDLQISYENWSGDVTEAILEELSHTTPIEAVPKRQAWRDRRLMSLAGHLARDVLKFGP